MSEEISTRNKVTFILKAIPHYRLPFYEQLRPMLDERGIKLSVVYGQVGSEGATKRDTVDLPWGIEISNKILSLGTRELYWQPTLSYIRDADLVIVMQESKLLINYLLVLLNMLGVKRAAFWGHGKSFQEHRTHRWSELIKKWISRNVHWWFAYTQSTYEVIRSLGFPEPQITGLYNNNDLKPLKTTQSKN